MTLVQEKPQSIESDAAIAAVEQQFAVMYRQGTANIRSRATRVHPDLAPVAYAILNTLAVVGRTHAGEVAAKLGADKSIISRQVGILEGLGLVSREADATDRRSVILALTAVGAAKMNEVRSVSRKQLYDQLRDWDVADLQKLAELLGRLNEIRL